VYVDGELVQEPREVVNVSPVRAVPVITGSAVFVGAISVTTVVGSDNAALDDPTPFVATTANLMKYPTSNSVTTYELDVAEAMSE
jgi:hypothetical protein